MKRLQIEVADARRAVRQRVVELAARRGVDASGILDDDSIADQGALDSVGVLELVMWVETTYDLSVGQADLTAENFGTIEAVAGYIQRESPRPPDRRPLLA